MAPLRKIKNICHDIEAEFQRAPFAKKVIRETIYSRHGNIIYQEYMEVLLIARRLESNLRKHNRISKKLLQSTPTTNDWNKAASLRQSIQLEIKMLYTWAYHIEKALSPKDSANPFKKQVDLKELERICLFRNKFVTHYAAQPHAKKYAKSGAGYIWNDENPEEFRLGITGIFKTQRKHWKALKPLVNSIGDRIPELRMTTNRYEQIELIYRHLNKLSNPLYSDAIALIKLVGVPSEYPAIILEGLLAALQQYRRAI